MEVSENKIHECQRIINKDIDTNFKRIKMYFPFVIVFFSISDFVFFSRLWVQPLGKYFID